MLDYLENHLELSEEMKERITSLPDPKGAIVKRIIEEITGKERNKLFVI